MKLHFLLFLCTIIVIYICYKPNNTVLGFSLKYAFKEINRREYRHTYLHIYTHRESFTLTHILRISSTFHSLLWIQVTVCNYLFLVWKIFFSNSYRSCMLANNSFYVFLFGNLFCLHLWKIFSLDIEILVENFFLKM